MPSCGLNYHQGKREPARCASPIHHWYLFYVGAHDCADAPVCLEFPIPVGFRRRGMETFARSNGADHGGDQIMRLTSLRTASFTTLAAVLSCMAIGSANASSTIEPVILAASCANCHGTDGHSPGSIPPIAGIPYPILKAKLESFKSSPAPDATVMPRLMRAYDTEQIEQLARYFSTIKPEGRP